MTDKEYYDLVQPYHDAMKLLLTRLEVLNHTIYPSAASNPVHTVQSRIKKKASIEEKLMHRGLEPTVDNAKNVLQDIAGVRVICCYIDDIYALADLLTVHKDFHLVKTKDYIKNPKPNGYRSFHMIIEVPIYTSTGKQIAPVEIQIRTIAMDFWASLEHQLHYKSIGNATASSSLTGELKHCAETIASIDLKMQEMFNQINNL